MGAALWNPLLPAGNVPKREDRVFLLYIFFKSIIFLNPLKRKERAQIAYTCVSLKLSEHDESRLCRDGSDDKGDSAYFVH